jgi:hypothetical protein
MMRAAILGESFDGKALLLVEVKANAGDLAQSIARLRAYLNAADSVIPYAMLVDREQIRLYKWDGTVLNGPIFMAETVPTLCDYADVPDNSSIRGMSEQHLTTLVKIWLRDLAYHWKSATPPGTESLAAIGFLPLLNEMVFRSEVAIGGCSVP